MKIKDVTLGATGRFPYGRLEASDEGELRVAIAADVRNGVVRVEFGKPIAWFALPSGLAREWARALLEKADDVDKGKA